MKDKDGIEILEDSEEGKEQEEGQEKLLAGKYKTVEELEKAYKSSQQEATTAVQRAKLADEYETQFAQLEKEGVVRRDATGRIVVVKKEAKPDVDPDDLDDTEKLALDDVQWKAVDKHISRRLKAERETFQSEKSQEEIRQKYTQAAKEYWNQACEEWPELLVDDETGKKVINKDSELYKEAVKIINEKYTEKLPNGQFYVPPQAQYDAVMRADRILRKRKGEDKDENRDSAGIKKQNKLVDSGRGGKGERKTKELSDEEDAALSKDEQEKYDRESIGL